MRFVRWSDSDRAAAENIGDKLNNSYSDQPYSKAGEEVHKTIKVKLSKKNRLELFSRLFEESPA